MSASDVVRPTDTPAQITEPPPHVPPRRRGLARYDGTLLGVLGVLLVLGLWSQVSLMGLVRPLFLPSPKAVGVSLVDYIKSPDFGTDIKVSGQELFAGYGLAVLVALPVGILMGWYRVAYYMGDPVINFFNSLPRIALAPLTIVWFGVGLQSKIAVVFASAVFPILMSTVSGVRSIDRDFIRVARLYGAGDLRIFKVVALPGSVPYILSGMRIGIGHALIGVVVGELIAAQHGIGLVIANAGQTFQTSLTFAAIIIVGFVGLVLTSALSLIERRFDRWRVR